MSPGEVPAPVDWPEQTVIGVEVAASNDDPSSIGALWGRWHGEQLGARIDSRDAERVIAIYADYEGDHTQPYRFMLGLRAAPDAPVPEGMVKRVLPAGPYLPFHAEGELPGALIATWMAIWEAPIERAFAADFEIHDLRTPTQVAVHVGVRAPAS